MFSRRITGAVCIQWPKTLLGISLARSATATPGPTFYPARLYPTRGFNKSSVLNIVKPVLLADIGEGIVECEVIQWFVEPGAHVEEFSPLCEVQSDKASVEITSRFTGVVKKLHYEAGEMAKVGKPFIEIDIQDGRKEDLEALIPPEPEPKYQTTEDSQSRPKPPRSSTSDATAWENRVGGGESQRQQTAGQSKGKHASLATPAIRHLSKELKLDILKIEGTGRDGRVLKEDIYKYVERQKAASQTTSRTAAESSHAPEAAGMDLMQEETVVDLSRTQEMMFKTMTRSLSIPHFLYADEIDFTSLVELRGRLNKVLAKPASPDQVNKLSYLPFIVKAVSMVLYKYPILNARVDSSGPRPQLVLRSQHNIGVAMDTPAGLLVPVVKNVGDLNVLGIAAEMARLQGLATVGKLAPGDMSGGTITISNIGTIGGTYLSPVIVEREVAILAVGRTRVMPAFDSHDRVVKKHVCNFSWSADHRVVDGATLARAAELVRGIVEDPDVMVMHLR